MYKLKRKLAVVLLLSFLIANSSLLSTLRATEIKDVTESRVTELVPEEGTASESSETEKEEAAETGPAVTEPAGSTKAPEETKAAEETVPPEPSATAGPKAETEAGITEETKAEKKAETRRTEAVLPKVLSSNPVLRDRNSLRAEGDVLIDNDPNNVIGRDHPQNPGDVMLFKKVDPVPGMVNTWDITLRVEAKQQTRPVYTVLLLDISGSMDRDDEYPSKLDHAKTAAKNFVDEILAYPQNRVALATFSYMGYNNHGFTDDKDALKNAIDALSAYGGTHTQGGLDVAHQMFDNIPASDANHENAIDNIVLLSDGEPTYSIGLNYNSYFYNIDFTRIDGGFTLGTEGNQVYYSNDYWNPCFDSTSGQPENYYLANTLNNRVGNGWNSRVYRTSVSHGWRDYYYFQNHANAAIDEAYYYKNSADDRYIYSIALETDTGEPTLRSIASAPASEYFSKASDAEQLNDIFERIATKILRALQDAQVGDPMGTGFAVNTGSVNNWLIRTVPEDSEVIRSADLKSLQWNPGELNADVPGAPNVKYAEIVYRIEIDDDIIARQEASGEGDAAFFTTNGEASISFTNINGKTQSGLFPNPEVNPVLYLIRKVVKDIDGSELAGEPENKDFTVHIKDITTEGEPLYDKSFTVNPAINNSTTLITSLRRSLEYEVFEDAAHEAYYSTKYFVGRDRNFAQHPETDEFAIASNDDRDVYITVENTRKPGSITIEKVLIDSLNSRSRNALQDTREGGSDASFVFTIQGRSFPQEQRFILPSGEGPDRWKKTFSNLQWGTYTIKEITDGLPYEASYEVNNVPQTGNSVQVTLNDGTGNQLVNTVKVTNRRTEAFEVKAEKVWGAGTTPVDLWFKLYREHAGGSGRIQVGANAADQGIKALPAEEGVTSAVWSQMDYPELLQYDSSGRAYKYFAQEVDAAGNDYTPEGMGKLENGLEVINFLIPDLSLGGSKNLSGREPEDGEFTFEFYKSDAQGTQGALLGSSQNSGSSFSISLSHIDKLGTSYVLIKEKNENQGGITYDPALYLLKVETSYNSTLKKAEHSTELYKKQGQEWIPLTSGKIVFSNTYTTEGSYTPEAEKVLVGRELAANAFTFALYKVEGGTETLLETAKNQADGRVSFSEIAYDEAGTYQYRIKEVQPDNGNKAEGMSYSEELYDITVTAEEKNPPDGTLKVTAVIKKGQETAEKATFTNTYAPQTSVEPIFRKQINNIPLQEGDFSFSLTSEDHPDFAEMTASNDANGQVKFAPIVYTLADAGKTYTYKIKEIVPDPALEYIGYDTHETTMSVKITDSYPKGLTAAVTYETANDEWIFKNVYKPQGSWTPTAKKVFTGYDGSLEDKFTFELRKGSVTGSVLESKKTDADGDVVFSPINFGAADIGQHYVYYITEKAGTSPGVHYSNEIKTIDVYIVDKGEGELQVCFDPDKTVTEQPEQTITNTYFAKGKWTPVVSKKLQGRSFLTDDDFAFSLWETEADFAVSGDPLQTVHSADGSIPFTPIDYTAEDPDDAVTHYYVIKEVLPEENPSMHVTYDTAEVHVTVVAEPDDTTAEGIRVTATYVLSGGAAGQSQQSFVNVYEAEAKWQPKVKKTLNGRPLEDQEFIFIMTEQAPGVTTERTERKANNAAGYAVFDEITYTQEDIGKEFTYTFVEEEPDNLEAGMSYDPSSYEMKVSVDYFYEDGGLILNYTFAKDGEMLSSPNPEIFTFVNSYEASGKWIPEVSKKLSGRALEAGEFTFKIYKMNGEEAVEVEGITGTNEAAAEGKAAKIVFNKKMDFDQKDIGQSYTYEIREVVPATDPDYMTYDRTPVKVTLNISDLGEGKLGFTEAYAGGKLFANRYTAEGSWTPPAVNKIFKGGGRPLGDEEFSFELKQTAPLPAAAETQVVKNNAEGEAVFAPISYTQADLGKTFSYKMREIIPAEPAPGMTYDATVYTFTVTLTDDKAGNLTPVVTVSPEMTDEKAAFTNVYKASGEWQILAAKELQGRLIKDEEFSFSLEKENDENFPVQLKKNGADGSLAFDKLTFDESDIGKTYTYIIKEVIPDNPEGGMSYDNTEYKLTLEITDGGDGSLNITPTYSRGAQNFTPADGRLHFSNTYKASGEITLSARKLLQGRALKAGEFTFVLKDANGNVIDNQALNDADGNITFKKITYDERYINAHIEYSITELKGTLGGVSYDPKEVQVLVTVTDKGNGKLEAAVKEVREGSQTVNEVLFNNTYNAEGSWTPAVTKVLEAGGRKLKAGEFTFRLSREGSDEVLEEVSNKADGTVQFSTRRDLTLEDVGKDVKYIISEVNKGEGGMSYAEPITVTLTVTDLGNGQLEITADYSDQGVMSNTYTAKGSWTAEVTKKFFGGGRTLQDGEFEFAIREKRQDTILARVRNDKDGRVIFENLPLSEEDIGKEIEYQVFEIVPDDPEEGMDYCPQTAEFTVTVSDLGGGKLKAEVEEPANPNFGNFYHASGSWTPELVMKDFRAGGRELKAGEFSFGLFRDDSAEALQTVKNDAEGRVIFQDVKFTEKDIGKEMAFTVREIIPAEDEQEKGLSYGEDEVSFLVYAADEGNGKLAVKAVRSSNTAVITNVYRASGDWNPGLSKELQGRRLKDGEFTFELRQLEPADESRTQKVKNKADGSIPFKNISFTEEDIGKVYLYQVKELIPQKAEERMSYDEKAITLQVEVIDNGNGKIGTVTKLLENKDHFVNKYEPKTTELTVKKIWEKGPSKHPEIQVQLYRNGEIFGAPVTLKDTDTYTWKNVTAEDFDGKAYTFTVKEVKVPEGYTVSYSKDTFTITNTYIVVPKTGQSPYGLQAALAVLTLAALAIFFKRKLENGSDK